MFFHYATNKISPIWKISTFFENVNILNPRSHLKANSWSIHFFAVEVGAQGYCASTIRSCLMHLGLTSKLVRSSLKTLF